MHEAAERGKVRIAAGTYAGSSQVYATGAGKMRTMTQHYARWPDAHRPERAEDAIRLDRLLGQVWGEHPHYHRLDNDDRGWQAKAQAARALLDQYCAAAE